MDATDTNIRGEDHILEVGDAIIGKHTFGVNRYPITRVTPKFAFSRVSDTYEAKFHRDTKNGLEPLPRHAYSRVNYTLDRAAK